MSLQHEAQEVEIEIPEGYDDSTRRQIAEDVIDLIVNRTNDGLNINNKSFKGLSPEYKKFKMQAIGDSSPDLTFTGEMLGDLKYKPSKSSKTKLVVGYNANTFSNAKAKGHITGDIGVKRDFLGISKKDLNNILSKYEREESSSLLSSALILKNLIGRLK